MMISGVGTDICSVARIEELYLKQPKRFAEKLLTADEQLLFESATSKPHFLAKRFALKEAISKALGTGIGSHLSFQDIEISRKSGQKPKAVLKRKQFEHITLHISVSDEKEHVVAFAVAEC